MSLDLLKLKLYPVYSLLEVESENEENISKNFKRVDLFRTLFRIGSEATTGEQCQQLTVSADRVQRK